MNTIENNLIDNLLNHSSHKTSTNISNVTNSIRPHQTRQYQNLNYDDENSIKAFAFDSCKEYLGGSWKTIRLNKFIIEKVSGGLSNYLYACSLPENVKPIGNEPIKVLLRIYGENHHTHSSIILKDVVVSAIMSDKNLGPKLYGVLPIGRIEEYIPSMQLTVCDLHVPKTSSSIAKILAKFHTLEMPFVKEPRWLFDTITRYLNHIENIKFNNENDLKKMNRLMSYNLADEFKVLVELLNKVDSPVVFCHNDVQPGNILRLNDDNLIIIDYEYGSYNYRGFDFGNHFCEWMMVNNYDRFPYFKCNPKQYPNREQQLNFINSYLKEYFQLNNEQITDNSQYDAEKLLLEANYFALASHYFWTIWSICQAATSKITFSYLDYALARIDLYQKQKEKIINGIIPPILN